MSATEVIKDVKSAKEEEKDELAILDALDREASEYNKDAEIDRILKSFKLDAYAVLDLQPGVPDSAIKATYRKKSLLIHPDKTTNPSAPAAFDLLKKAESCLMDEKQRQHLDECISDARMLLMREHKYTVDSAEMRDDMGAALKAEWRRLTVRVLVEGEARRRRQLKAQMQEEGREQKRVDDEVEERKRKREFEGKWEATREERIGSWRDFKAGAKKEGGGVGEGRKKKKLKVLG